MSVGAKEGSARVAGISVTLASAFQLSEGVPTALVGCARVTAPIVTKTPTPSAADIAFQLPRRLWKFMGPIDSLLHRAFAVWRRFWRLQSPRMKWWMPQ